jgi:ClpP class serine protease
MATLFPRGTDAPAQSPLFWVNNKDRYLRQLLISDIQAVTGRDLLVYFTSDHSNAQIDGGDDIYLSELLSARSNDQIDLMIETPGGYTDATEKVCSILRNAKVDLRVVVPRKAKSNGTVIAFCGKSIVMSRDSELGPIDPFVNNIPADYIVKLPPGTPGLDPIMVLHAQSGISQTTQLAESLLSSGMLKNTDQTVISALVKKLAARDQYHSHGAVIDADEAIALGLNVELLESNSPLWQKFWLLRTMYAHDCQQREYAKLFESARISSPVAQLRPPK